MTVNSASSSIHRVYIDDSGEKEYGEKTSRYFVFGGLVVSASTEDKVVKEIAALKIATFGTPNVELKSNWLRIPKERKRRYLERYHITEAQLAQFITDLSAWITTADLTFVAAVVDKTQMKLKYAKPWHPSTVAYQFLLQRYQKHVVRIGGVGQVTIDDMDGASPAQNQWRDLLRTHHTRLKKDGCGITKLRFDNIAPGIRFGDSARFHQLQIADLMAYNVFRQFRQYGDDWDGAKADMPFYGPLKPMLPRFMRGPGPKNQLEGWGIIKWPAQHDGKWCLTPEELRGA